MKRICKVGFLVLCLSVCALAQPNKFPYDKADMPFNATAVERSIDKTCSEEGSGQTAPKQAESRSKNNFGATGSPITIRVTDFDRLEKATLKARKCWANNLPCPKLEIDIPSGLPADRQQLVNIATTSTGEKIGEGTIVVLEAKVLNSHYSNTKYNIYGFSHGQPNRGSGESVNCKSKQVDGNDIHIVLVAPGITNECLSVTAEISPHFRPDSWRRFHNMKKNQLGEDINQEAKGINFSQLQSVRLTGPLFYDASHQPCSPGHVESPARRSIWEIHPVFKLEVKSGGQWMSFEDWVNSH